IRGILVRVLERRDVAVSGIADDKGNPAIGMGFERSEAHEDQGCKEGAASQDGKFLTAMTCLP
ncbi:hypothetical protein, partial [Mesorhizobium sp. M8A.F.Ca.ET.197.01.1.1]|uniref:hypothetical protein n=1 Tax=Mesorhizobium sp. M8A.F.Ca.ET.197.01.1.1 TaxID=2563965 RepID=UPI00143F5F9E